MRDHMSLGALSLRERVDHLEHCLSEITRIPAEYDTAALGVPKMRRQTARILAALLREKGRVVTKSGLLAAACWDRPEHDWPDIRIVDVQVSHARKALRDAGLPFVIETFWGTGYRVTDAPC